MLHKSYTHYFWLEQVIENKEEKKNVTIEWE